jgi:hypothetical protein
LSTSGHAVRKWTANTGVLNDIQGALMVLMPSV